MLSVNAALAHGYHAGPLEITHPAIMVPSPQSDCSCAHVKIINHGSQTEYFLGAVDIGCQPHPSDRDFNQGTRSRNSDAG